MFMCLYECFSGIRIMGICLYVYSLCNRLNMFDLFVVIWEEICVFVDEYVGVRFICKRVYVWCGLMCL